MVYIQLKVKSKVPKPDTFAYEYSENELQQLTAEIMELFLADNKLDTVEQCIYMMLNKILRKN